MMAHANQAIVSDASAPPVANVTTGLKPLPFVLQIAGLMAVISMALFGFAWWSAGSLELAWPLLRGQRLVFVPPEIECGVVPPGEIFERQIRVVNLSSKPLTLTGSQPSCQCITLDEFPIVIPQGKEHQLALKIGAPKTAGPFEHSIKIFTSVAEPPTVIIVSGVVK